MSNNSQEGVKINANDMKNGIIFAPYICKTSKTTINSETVWHSNRFINLLLRIKRFFYKSKNIKNSEKYMNKKIDVSKYGTFKPDTFNLNN
jgi:hypothetical protein